MPFIEGFIRRAIPSTMRHLKAVRSHGIKNMVPSKRGASKSRGLTPGIFLKKWRPTMSELSVFVDESGDLGGVSNY